MKKEIWILIPILLVIYGTIYIFSSWNKSHYGHKRKQRKQNQINSCVILTDTAESYGISWSFDECKHEIVGMNYSNWQKISICIRDHKNNYKQLLTCTTNKMCELDIKKGCYVYTQALLKSPKEELNGANKLYKMCKRDDDVKACMILTRWIDLSSNDNHKFDDAFNVLCEHGDGNSCKKIHKDPVLETCINEKILQCKRQSQFSRNLIVQFLACEYGDGKSCVRFDKRFPGVDQKAGIFNGCLKGDFESCGKWGYLHGNEQLLTYACRENSFDSCNYLMKRKIKAIRQIFLKDKLCRNGQEKYCF